MRQYNLIPDQRTEQGLLKMLSELKVDLKGDYPPGMPQLAEDVKLRLNERGYSDNELKKIT